MKRSSPIACSNTITWYDEISKQPRFIHLRTQRTPIHHNVNALMMYRPKKVLRLRYKTKPARDVVKYLINQTQTTCSHSVKTIVAARDHWIDGTDQESIIDRTVRHVSTGEKFGMLLDRMANVQRITQTSRLKTFQRTLYCVIGWKHNNSKKSEFRRSNFNSWNGIAKKTVIDHIIRLQTFLSTNHITISRSLKSQNASGTLDSTN